MATNSKSYLGGVPVTATNTQQLQEDSKRLSDESRKLFQRAFVKAVRSSRSAPAHLTTTAKLMEECEESSGQRPRTCFEPKSPLLNPVDEIHESSSSSTLDSATQNQFDPQLEQTDIPEVPLTDEELFMLKYEPFKRLPLSEEFPALTAEDIQDRLEETWNQVSMTLLARPQFQSQRDRVMEWLQTKSDQKSSHSNPLNKIV